MTDATAAHPIADRITTARMILNLGLAVAVLPAIAALGAVVLVRMGAIDWWTGYGQVLVGDGSRPGFALQASLAAIAAAATGLAVTLWAGPERLYARAMLNMTITAVSLAVLLAVRG